MSFLLAHMIMKAKSIPDLVVRKSHIYHFLFFIHFLVYVKKPKVNTKPINKLINIENMERGDYETD